MSTAQATALIAEDEPVLARGLARVLNRLWPALRIQAIVHDGDAAVESATQTWPDIVFLDIQMPGCTGLEAAEQILAQWPADRPDPLLVFVTAFDRFAIDAFERAATDYVLKPLDPKRLSQTCERLQARLDERRQGQTDTLTELRSLLDLPRKEPRLQLIQAGVGSTLHMVPMGDVHYFEADDKYVRVVLQNRSVLIRTPLRDLLPTLDTEHFTQIHRSTVVRTTLIDKVVREDNGKIHLYLKGHPQQLTVSRSYAHLFKPM
jgi:DNA-binding LytR/AlgR family response regulator